MRQAGAGPRTGSRKGIYAMMRMVKVAVACAFVGFLVAAPPAFLIGVIGNPWPSEGVVWDAPLTDGAILAGLAALLWVFWAQMTLSFAVETYAAITDRAVLVRLPVLGMQQDLARFLIGAIISSAAVTPFAPGVVAHQAAASPAPAASTQAPALGPPGMGATDSADTGRAWTSPVRTTTDKVSAAPAAEPVPTPTRTGATIVVRRGDTLWSLAEGHLGDGERWSDIAAANLGKKMTDGTLFSAAGAIRPGWRLLVPGIDAATTPTSHNYVVQPGDTLWEIAESHLGDGARYPEVYEASTDIAQPGGARLIDPDHIEPGWTVATGATGTRRGERDLGAGAAGLASPSKPDPRTPVPRDSVATQTPPAQDRSPSEAEQKKGPSDVSQTDAAASWMLPGLSAAGALLAAGMLLGLRRRRRDQVRVRRPGRATQGPPPEARWADMTVHAVGSMNAETVALIDETLRELARHQARTQAAMPPLVAVEVRRGRPLLHFAVEVELDPPWQAIQDSRSWHLPSDWREGTSGWVEAPYPLLVSVGEDATGGQWLLNLELPGVVEVVGDRIRCSDFARHLAAQLAVHPWSQQADVDSAGLGDQVAALGENIHHHESRNAAITRTALFVAQTRDRSRHHDVDAATGRIGRVDDDVWSGRALFLGGTAETGHGSEQEVEDRLIARLLAEPGLTGSAAVLVDHAAEPASDARLVLPLDEAGRLHLQAQGVTVHAVGLTEDEAAACAVLYQHAEQLDDVPMPVDEGATEGWEAYADRAGGLRSEYTLLRDSGQDETDDVVASVLEHQDEVYVREAACVPEDLQAVAPSVPATIRNEVEGADPMLASDLEAWWNPDDPRPKVGVLGPVTVRTKGKPLVKNKAIYTELVVYLATRRRTGATRDEVAEAFAWGTDPGRVRKHVNVVRDWLGIDRASGRPFLPHADKAPAAATRGVNVYQLDAAVLLDADLFKRLILRGRARGGSTGRADLQQALDLVEGRPFDQIRAGGWNWLFDGERLDQYLAMSVADVAFTLVTHYLAAGELASARKAATIGINAAPDEEATRLCMVRVQEAEGNRTEAQRMLLNDLYAEGDDGDLPNDVSDRTSEVVRVHRWAAG